MMKWLHSLLLVLLMMPLVHVAAQSRKLKIPTSSTGIQDRRYWVDLLYRISFPVLDNLANSRLRLNMPVEKAPGYYLPATEVTYLEAVGRTLAGLAPWLAVQITDPKEEALRNQLQKAALRGLRNAVDPSNPDYLNFRTEHQPIVDAAFLAHAFLRAPTALWVPLDSLTKSRIITEFKSLRNRQPGNNNWLLFGAITEAFLLDAGEQPDTARIMNAVRQFRKWYVGDGHYSDGDLFAMDYYNSFVIHPMLVDLLEVLYKHGFAEKQEYELAVKRMTRYEAVQERMISPEGTFPPVGRSLPYRIAAFQALAQTSLLHQLPPSISPPQVRNALTTVMHNLFDVPGTFDKKGWLTIGFAGHQPSIADPYTSTGSLYLCTTGFIALGLPESDPFWSLAPQPWTSQKAWGGGEVEVDHKEVNK
jgi:hypothetical protein